MNKDKFFQDVKKSLKANFDVGELFNDDEILEFVRKEFDLSAVFPDDSVRLNKLIALLEDIEVALETNDLTAISEKVKKARDYEDTQPDIY